VIVYTFTAAHPVGQHGVSFPTTTVSLSQESVLAAARLWVEEHVLAEDVGAATEMLQGWTGEDVLNIKNSMGCFMVLQRHEL